MNYELTQIATVVLSLTLVSVGLYFILETKDAECETDEACECC